MPAPTDSIDLTALTSVATVAADDRFYLVSDPAGAQLPRQITATNLFTLSGVHFTGTLPVARGGTNSATALNNGRVMISSAGAIVERAALTASALVVGDATNGVAALALGTANQVVGMNAGATANEYKSVLGTINEIDITHAANSITIGLVNPLIVGKGGTGADLSATGGANQFVKQSSAGAAFTVGTISSADLPAHTHALSAITAATGDSGTVNHADYAIIWQWTKTTTGETSFRFTDNGSTNFGAIATPLVAIDVGASSYAMPLQVKVGTTVIMEVGGYGGAKQTAIDPGTQSSPALTFVANTDTGVYRPSANAVGLTAGGAEMLAALSSGVLRTTYTTTVATGIHRQIRYAKTGPAAIASGDNLYRMSVFGYVGATNTYVEAARLDIVSSGTITDATTGVGGHFSFTARTQGSALAEVARIDASSVQLIPFGTSAGNTTTLRFLELAANGTNYTAFKAADSLAQTTTYVWPSTDPTAGQFLSASAPSGGVSTLSWTSGGGAAWSALTAPTANLSLAHAEFTTVFTWGAGGDTGTSEMFTLQDTTGNVGTGTILRVNAANSSTIKPFRFSSGNISRTFQMDMDGNLLFGSGTLTAGTSASGAIHMKNGTAPSASITDGIILYAEDVAASSELKVRDEAGNTTVLGPHAFPLIPKHHPMAWSHYSVNALVGYEINVDMYRVVELVEKLTGEELIHLRKAA